jgi:DUF2934 family protein
MAGKPARRRSDKVVPMRTELTPPRSHDDEIARRAFELYCERGRKDGYDLEDWLQAEREVLASINSAVA